MFRSMRVRLAIALLSTLFCASQATATTYSWTFQAVNTQPDGTSRHVAAGMRTGATWPSVFYDGSTSMPSAMIASSLSPVGWTGQALQGLSGPSYVRSKPGSDGRVGIAWQGSDEINFAQSSALGWQIATVAANPWNAGTSAPDVAYLSGNHPVVGYSHYDGYNYIKISAYDDLGWTTETVTTGSTVVSGTHVTLDVDSQNRIGIAYNDTYSGNVTFALKDISWGTWYNTSIRASTTASNLSVAFGPNDETGVAILQSDGTLDFASFDIQSGTWQIDLLGGGVDSERVNLLYNSQGHPALSYVSDSVIHYRINDGGGWADITLPVGIDPDTGLTVTPQTNSDAALSFDGDDVPVIGYYSSSGLLLAYDPPVPEPASALLLVLGFFMLNLRRKMV